MISRRYTFQQFQGQKHSTLNIQHANNPTCKVFPQKLNIKNCKLYIAQSNRDDLQEGQKFQSKFPQIVQQTAQLVSVDALLILFPSKLFFGSIALKHWILFFLYIVFFFGGTVMRILKYGKLSARKKDSQVKNKVDRSYIGLRCIFRP
eukprot:TRINITY_DN1375_c0_g1_i10.p2 TRINITY_DN1375_c0_g1~~TRINITY_DN1375_c0_g1_i10.p2  ORF type:complete len:148 (+),score=0.63 TRINITY_DN1375_c0_g1_i10:226-669(+)